MKKLIILSIILSLVFSSCSLTIWEQRKSYVEKNQGNRPASILQAVESGSLAIGMNEKEARLVLNRYDYISSSSHTTKHTYYKTIYWGTTTYYTHYEGWFDREIKLAVHFEDGYVTSWSRI